MNFLKIEDVTIFFKKNGIHEVGLFHIQNKKNNFYDILKKLHKSGKQNLDSICVFSFDGYEPVKSHIVSMLNRIIENRVIEYLPSFELSLPNSHLTRDPSNVPVVLSDVTSWMDLKRICILPGWDFYELEWILRRWDSMLCSFDNDNFLVKPSYPKDIYNKAVHPSLILSNVENFVKYENEETLKHRYFALYLLSRDIGPKLLQFFYECETETWTRDILYKKLHVLYHQMDRKHPYRIYIFYQNCAGIMISNKKEFSMSMFINQYLSFHGMFVCQKFFKENATNISLALRNTMPLLYSFCHTSKKTSILKLLKDEMTRLHGNDSYSWISREHLGKLSFSPFWALVHLHWHDINRNIYLWHGKSLLYSDSQMKVGFPLIAIFTQSQIANFENIPDEISL